MIVMMDGEPEIFQNIEMERDGSIPPEVLHFNGEVKEIGDGNLLVTYLSTGRRFYGAVRWRLCDVHGQSSG